MDAEKSRTPLNDLIVVFRDIRQFRDRQTGQVQFTREPQDVHFHLRAFCLRDIQAFMALAPFLYPISQNIFA